MKVVYSSNRNNKVNKQYTYDDVYFVHCGDFTHKYSSHTSIVEAYQKAKEYSSLNGRSYTIERRVNPKVY
jgi:hypothetical protein